VAILAALDLASVVSVALNILYVVLGLGLVIFFHELGHFAVAKWCNVYVERFSIGFGPIIWSRKRGETEYALSWIPFGGYVKMLGQDDMDPSQLSSEEIARDPRSYSAKPVHQRMAIISAGVIMNVITGLLFFATAFGLGVEQPPAVLGGVQPGLPAWKAGMSYGDRITRIDDRAIDSFGDIMRGVALSTGPIDIEGVHRDGTTFEVSLTPDASGTRRLIGAEQPRSLRLIEPDDAAITPVTPGTPAGKSEPPLKSGDQIRRVGEVDVKTFADFQDILAARRGETLGLVIERKGAGSGDASETVEVQIGPNPFRTLGLQMEIGPIAAIKEGSPAVQAELQVGDKITHVNDQDVGKVIDPLQLPDFLASLNGQEVMLRVKRPVKGAAEQELTVSLVPENLAGWVEVPRDQGVPLSAPAIGIAYHLIPIVIDVQADSAAAKAGLKPQDRILEMELVLPAGAADDWAGPRSIELEFNDDTQNWAYAFWLMQVAPTRSVTLRFARDGQVQQAVLEPKEATDWFLPDTRGIRLAGLVEPKKAASFGEAMSLGLVHTRDSITDIYLTLRNLLARNLSVKELHGPVGIAAVAYSVASQGLADLLLFLGFLSVNLAVLNFLPIPVLDGGHMVFLIWEAVTRKRPSERVMVAATYFGMAFVLGLMFLVLYLDIFVHRLGIN
jgi:regulator of sigma E protease